ncbi:uncharacterized protein N7459_006506 [Penicillium hispanicum]|uniref:uncharacterized protein n=1 Tax=Penicillium hispanicum TaxID=1080232 RepID=UPI0025402CAB|nr:uncharacterized protein N7459_006506 [Penicillium hispanicum]KAJ5577542.1 hypothetical protein N7459_006506 [Penicillium hispanicum]
MTEYLYTVFNTTYLGYVKWGDNILNGIVEQGGDLVNFSARENGIVKWIQDGSFTTQISDDWTINLDAKSSRAATAAGINLEWLEEEMYFVNTTDALTWGWDNYTESGLNLDKNDMYRVNLGDEIWLAIKHTNGTGPADAYSPPPGWTMLDKLSLTGEEVVNASVWSQHKIGFNTTWEPTLAQSYLYSDDSPPGDIFMTIPVCQLAQMPAPASLTGRTCMDVKIADEVSAYLILPPNSSTPH